MNILWICLVLGVVGTNAGRTKRQYVFPRQVVQPTYQFPSGVPQTFVPPGHYDSNLKAPVYTQQISYSHDPFYGAVRPGGSAICKLVSAPESNVTGEIHFHQGTSIEPVQIFGQVEGLSAGKHGFHIHRTGDTGDDCKAAGPHFSVDNSTHGAPTDKVRHAGDLGNIEANDKGIAPIGILDSYISLALGSPRQIIGRAVVVHAGEDDLGKGGDDESLKTGNAGARVACCVIEPVGY